MSATTCKFVSDKTAILYMPRKKLFFKLGYQCMPYCSRCLCVHDRFHGSCVGISEYEASYVGAYKCPGCSTEQNTCVYGGVLLMTSQ